jgi:hypothetical protein
MPIKEPTKAKCPSCDRVISKADGCIFTKLIFKENTAAKESPGTTFERYKVGQDPGWENKNWVRCGDCGAKTGFYHHPGCDIEICPRCKDQFIGCDCGLTGAFWYVKERVTPPPRKPKPKPKVTITSAYLVNPATEGGSK